MEEWHAALETPARLTSGTSSPVNKGFVSEIIFGKANFRLVDGPQREEHRPQKSPWSSPPPKAPFKILKYSPLRDYIQALK